MAVYVQLCDEIMQRKHGNKSLSTWVSYIQIKAKDDVLFGWGKLCVKRRKHGEPTNGRTPMKPKGLSTLNWDSLVQQKTCCGICSQNALHNFKRHDCNENTYNTVKSVSLRGYCTPNQKLACFVFYLKIISTFLKNDICIL